jgi:hypothetical protein
VQNDCTEKVSKSEIEDFFERVWKLYPNKKGKGQVSDATKKKLYKIGYDQVSIAIQRYQSGLNNDTWRQVQNGSTFFTSGYVDYLDSNYHPSANNPPQVRQRKNGFNDFPQRTYSPEDYTNIEKKLISKTL